MTAQARAWTGGLGGAIAFADAMTYLVLIYKQGESSAIVPWVFSLIAAGAIAAIYGSFTTQRYARLILGAAASLFLVLGVIGIFSIGLPLLLAAGLCFFGARSSRRRADVGSRRNLLIGVLAITGLVGATLFLTQLVAGGQKVSVRCTGSAAGPGMPALVGPHPSDAPARPHPCHTIVSH
jgi:hypothetical protein